MSAPDRSRQVVAIMDTLTVAPESESDDGRRRNLYEIGRRLNRNHPEDRGHWGVLVKADQNGKIPADILVWKPTLEHFDVLTGAGQAAWQPRGVVTNPAWVWRAVPAAPVPVPEPPEAPGPVQPVPDLTPRIEAMEGHITELAATVTALRAAVESLPPVQRFSPVAITTAPAGSWPFKHSHSVLIEQPTKR